MTNQFGDSEEDIARAYADDKVGTTQKAVVNLAEAISILQKQVEALQQDVKSLLRETRLRKKIS